MAIALTPPNLRHSGEVVKQAAADPAATQSIK
jgi:hypothetical protein